MKINTKRKKIDNMLRKKAAKEYGMKGN